MNKKFFFIFRVIVGLAILFALFKFIPYNKLIEIYKNSQKTYLFLGILVFYSCVVFGILRWKILLRDLGIKISFREASYAYFSATFFNLFFPSFVAGDIFRGFSISHRYKDVKKSASSVFMDRFSGATALVMVCIISFAVGRKFLPQREVLIPVLILFFGIVLSFLIIFSKKFFSLLIKFLKENSSFRKKLISFHDQLYFFKQNPKAFARCMFFSIIIQLLVPISFFILSKGFGLKIGIIYFLILVPIVMVIALIPITIAGMGTREAAAVYFFSLIGVEKGIGLSMSLINLFCLVFMGIVGGIFYVTIYHRWLQSRT